MKRLFRFVLVLVIAIGIVSFLPLFIKPTMLRSWRTDHVGDVIEWGWKITTLSSFWSDYHYLRREQKPALWLAVNLALAFTYALVIAFGIDQFLARRKRTPRSVN